MASIRLHCHNNNINNNNNNNNNIIGHEDGERV